MTATIDRAGRVAARPARRSPARRRRRNLVTLALLAPALLGLADLLRLPAASPPSTTRSPASTCVSPPQWIGLRNYEYLFTQDPNVWHGDAQHAVVRRDPGAGEDRRSRCSIAGLLARARRASGVWRTLFYLPALVPPVASVVAFVFLFNPGTGPVNQVLALVRHQGAAVVQRPRVVEAVARAARRLGDGRHHDHLPGRAARRAARAVRGGLPRRRERRAEGPLRHAADASRRCCCSPS